MKIKETELFYPLNRYFSALGYIINTEVELGNRADILLTREDSEDLVEIETKTNLSFELLDQAYYWKKYTDLNYICVPKTKTIRPKIVNKIISDFGIGLIEIDLKKYYKYYGDLENEPYKVFYFPNKEIDLQKLGISFSILARPNKISPKSRKILQSVIYKEHQTWSISGQPASATHVSGYKLLMFDVYSFMRHNKQEHPENDGWVTLNQIVDYLQNNSSNVVKNHYSNMKNGIREALTIFECGDIEKLNTGRKVYYRIMNGSTKYLNMNKRQLRS